MPGVTRAIVGCSTWANYHFLLPITALLWRERIGFDPYLILTGDWDKDERCRIGRRALASFGFETLYLGVSATPEEEGTLAQNCRQHAAAMPFPDGAFLITTDADLWPIKREFYQQHLRQGLLEFAAYYSNGDHYQSYPTCHVAATTQAWRKAYGLVVDGDVRGQTEKSHALWKETSPMYAAQANKPFAVWCSDQWMMTEKMKASGLPIHHIERRGHPPIDRIDREGLPEHWTAVDPTVFTDAHIHKGPFEEKRWGDVFRLASRLLPAHAVWFQAYRERYFAAFQNQTK